MKGQFGVELDFCLIGRVAEFGRFENFGEIGEIGEKGKIKKRQVFSNLIDLPH